MKPVFCFIDDASFELENFRQNAAPAFQGVEWVLAADWRECQDRLAGRAPLCFLLDLYGRLGDAPPSQLPRPDELEALLAGVASPGEILERARREPDPVNAFLRGLFVQVNRWQEAFSQAAQALGQSPAFGLANLAQVRREHPFAAALGYSRKALYQDAMAFTLAGGCGLLQKPQGGDPAAIARATRGKAQILAQACYRAVDRRLTHWGAHALAVKASSLLEGKGTLAGVAAAMAGLAKDGQAGAREDSVRQPYDILIKWSEWRGENNGR